MDCSLAPRKVRAAEESRANLRIRRQRDLHQEAAAGRIGSGNDLLNLAGNWLVAKRIDNDGDRYAKVDGAYLTLIHLDLQAKAARVFDDQQRNPGCCHGAGVNELGRDEPVKGSADAGESNCGICLRDCGLGLRATGVRSVPARFGRGKLRLHLVEFLRADRLLVVQHLVALHGRLSQRVVGIGGRDVPGRKLALRRLHPGTLPGAAPRRSR